MKAALNTQVTPREPLVWHFRLRQPVLLAIRWFLNRALRCRSPVKSRDRSRSRDRGSDRDRYRSRDRSRDRGHRSSRRSRSRSRDRARRRDSPDYN